MSYDYSCYSILYYYSNYELYKLTVGLCNYYTDIENH